MKVETLDLATQTAAPSANLEIQIEGLVLMYEKDGILKMAFPKAADHELKIEITKNGSIYASTIVPSRSSVVITHDHPISQTKTEFGQTLNIKKLHSNLKLISKKEYTSLTLANAVLEPSKDSNGNVILTEFEFWKILYDSFGRSASKVRQFEIEIDYPKGIAVAMNGGAEIAIGGSTKIEVTGSTPYSDSVSYAVGDKYKMIISNHCNKPECENVSDFYHYYNIFDPACLSSGGEPEYELVAPIVRSHRAPCNLIYSDSDLG